MDERPIGVFDSGVGGMTVLKELQRRLPKENFVYLGDTKRFPYGSKSKQTIIQLTKDGIEFLISKNVKLIVIACGTATSQALEEVQNKYHVPIIGVIEPAVEYLKQSNKKQIAVIATAGTVRSDGWKNAIVRKIPEAKLQSIACPLFAPMVEEGWYDNKIAKLVVKEYIKPLKKAEALILGCTHYPLLTKVIQKQIGKKTEIINIGIHVAKRVEDILKQKELFSNNQTPKLDIYLTEVEENFNKVASNLLGKQIQAKIVEEIEKAEA